MVGVKPSLTHLAAVQGKSASVNVQLEKECGSVKISAEVHPNNNSGLQPGMTVKINNNNCQPENSSLQFGLLAKVVNNNNLRHESSSPQSVCSIQAEDCVSTVHLYICYIF